MSSYRQLETPEVGKAVQVLGQALAEHQVSRRQKWLYRLLSLAVVLIMFGYGIVIIVSSAFEVDLGDNPGAALNPLVAVGMFSAGLGIVAVVPLSILNLGLIRKLWSMARARHRLGLNEALVTAFKAERRRHRLRNLLTGSVAVLGVVLVLLGTIGLLMDLESHVALRLILFVFFAIVGLSFASVHYIHRGVERLGIVERLYSELQPLDSAQATAEDVKISDHDYEIIARLERNQIIERREQSAARATHDPGAFGHSVQLSFAAQDAKDKLSFDEQNLVDEEILRLVRDPESEMLRSIADPDGLRTVRVKDASVELQYRIDDAAQRIQIARIASRHEPLGTRQ